MKPIRPYSGARNNVLTDFSDNFDRLIKAFENFPEFSNSGLQDMTWAPRIDVKEQKNQYIIYADVPGIDPANIEVSVDNGVLTIKGEKEMEQKEEKENFLKIERSSGSFMRQMTLPESIDASKVKARGKHGVLEITLPKSQKGTTLKIPVEK